MRNSFGLWVLAMVLLAIDGYVAQALRTVLSEWPVPVRGVVFTLHWFLSALSVVIVVAPFFQPALLGEKWFRGYALAMVLGLFISKLLGIVFFFLDDIVRAFRWLLVLAGIGGGADRAGGAGIPRSVFLSWLGLGFMGSFFGLLLSGYGNKYRYQTKRIRLTFPNLPKAFSGLKIVQVSDIHSGSLTDIAAVDKGIEKILALKPDLILFTGDLVNDRQEEVLPFLAVLRKLKAPMGTFSVLGNHDYGDYLQWPSQEAKTANLEKLKDLQRGLGWQLLMNENRIFEKDGAKIALIGIENYGAKGRFPKYGKMDRAVPGTENVPFKILMSHDPSHWEAQVLKEYPTIDLMLSGHTHGMQFGIENPYFRWSPVQWMYKQWAGLYINGKQHLYVNRGFGFIGYPGRVGILPEITLFELSAS